MIFFMQHGHYCLNCNLVLKHNAYVISVWSNFTFCVSELISKHDNICVMILKNQVKNKMALNTTSANFHHNLAFLCF